MGTRRDATGRDGTRGDAKETKSGKMSSNSLELLDEGRVFELVHHPARLERRPQSCSSASTSTQEVQKSCSKRAVSAVSRSLEALPPETPSSPPQVPSYWNFPPPPLPPPLATAASDNSSKGKERGFPLSEEVDSGKDEVLNSSLLLAPDKEQGDGEEVEVGEEQRGGPEVDRLMAEIKEMHLLVQALLKGSRGVEDEEEEEGGGEHKQQDLHRATLQELPATASPEEGSSTSQLKDSAGDSNISSSTPHGQMRTEQGVGQRKGKEEWEVLLGGEGELADRLRKAIAKMKKLDDKLASVTKRERELKLQRKLLEQQLAMLEAGPTGLSPLELEYKGEGLGVGQETDSDGSPSPPIFPVFATEIRSSSVSPTHTQLGGGGGVMGEGGGQGLEGRLQQPWSDAAGEEKPSGQLGQEGQGEKRKNWRKKEMPPRQDFIQRNIQLASDAGSGVAMTEEEKKRLESLLQDSDGEEGGGEEEEKAHRKQGTDCRTALVAYTRFGLDAESTQRLRDIESRLTMYGGGEMDRIGHTVSMSDSNLCQSGLSEPTECGSVSGEAAFNLDTVGRGDPMVERVRCERDDQLRMKEIDAQLRLLQQYKENEEEEEHSCQLPADQLQALLSQCRSELLAAPQGGPLTLDDAS